MKPAYEIHLSEGELADLGTLAVIMGQVEESFSNVVQQLLAVDRATASIMMKASGAELWAAVIRSRRTDEELLLLVEGCLAERNAVAQDRNDFIHGVFDLRQFGGSVSIGLGSGQVTRLGGVLMKTARRVSKDVERPVSELPGVVERAAQLSCLVAHVAHVATGGQSNDSPWLERIQPVLVKLRASKKGTATNVKTRRKPPKP